MLTWLHKELVGTETSTGQRISVEFYTGDNSLVGFHACFPRLSLNVQWLYMLEEDTDIEDEIEAFQKLMEQERKASDNILFTHA